MSTPPTVSVTPTWVKWLLGCLLVAVLAVFACCCGSCVLGRRVGERFQRVDAEQKLARESSSRVAQLDVDFPPRVPEDAAAAVITSDDVARYLRVRQAIAPQAAAYQRLEDSAFPGEGKGLFRGVFAMVQGSMDAPAKRRELIDAAEPALRAESMGPTDLDRMVEIVEWRFLRRPEARFLGLPPAERREYQQAVLEERMLSAWTQGHVPRGTRVNGRGSEDVAKDLERLRERIQKLAADAEQRVALTPETVAALEPHRAELEAMRPDGLGAMTPLTAEPVLTRFLQQGEGMHVERRTEWKFPKDDADGASGATSAPDAEPEAPVTGPSAATSP